LGQTKGSGVYSPGLDFAFGLVDDSYITKARDHGWLLSDTTMATPATSSSSEDLQIRMTLEPIKNLKIDLSATRTQTRSRSMEYVYSSTPTTESGTFSMTTISLKSAFEGIGDANNGFYSKSFEKFCNSLESFQKMVEAQYTGSQYPAGSTLAGKEFSATETPVDKYSADVMIPAFLKTYANGGGSLNIFPTLAKLLPNWSMRYSGLGKLPWFRDHFKSVNINHAYRSVYTVGSYNSYSNYQEYMNGWGFVINSSTGDPSPKSMYDISTVSISESFSPLLGVDMTFNNNLTAKVEYRSTRVLSLSMTSVQLNQASSKDWVVGMGYKINDFNLFGGSRKIKSRSKSGNNTTNSNSSKSTSGNTTKGQANRNLNLRLDVSYRNQASITRDIRTVTSTASSGNTAFKLSFSADYTLSRLLTMSFYYDRQTNNPLLTSSSYPTTTQDFGLSIKFSLTR
jgi:cell surface protein SprA